MINEILIVNNVSNQSQHSIGQDGKTRRGSCLKDEHLSQGAAGINTGEYSEFSELTSIRTYFASLAARVAVEAARR